MSETFDQAVVNEVSHIMRDRQTANDRFLLICERYGRDPLEEYERFGVKLYKDQKKDLWDARYKNIGYEAKFLTLASLPHRKLPLIPSFDEKGSPILDSAGRPIKQEQTSFARTNGSYTLELTASAKIGLPYGVMPRLLLTYLITEAIKNKSPMVDLGDTVKKFFDQIGLDHGGRSYLTIRSQAERLFNTAFLLRYDGIERKSGRIETIGNKYDMWWHGTDPTQATLYQNYVELSQDFYNEIKDNKFPIDMQIIKEIKDSSLALDIYKWLTFRAFNIPHETAIHWGTLAKQFGSSYSRVRAFRAEFIRQLEKVARHYKEVPLFVDARDPKHLILKPGKNLTSVKRLTSKKTP